MTSAPGSSQQDRTDDEAAPRPPRQLDRAAGTLLAAACGDALGVPYEFAARLGPGRSPQMIGGGLGPYEPGEYSDDTQMAVCIAEVAATGADLHTDDALDAIADRFLDWVASGASDIGAQTSAVLSRARNSGGRPAQALRETARKLHEQTGRTAGNGSLMRTGIVAVAYLDDAEAMAEAARAISDLTHPDPLAGDACVLWCAAIRRAILDATFDGLHEGLDLLPPGHRDRWAEWISAAEADPPAVFNPNGFVVPALQAAWSAITRTPVPADAPADGSFPCQHLVHALENAVRAGDDTDTVAAIAGALLGARWGASAVPPGWLRVVHGWPGPRAPDLIRLAVLTATGGRDDERGWPSVANRRTPSLPVMSVTPHPADDGVLLGPLGSDDTSADAVVSLCQTGRDDFPGVAAGDRVQMWLVDEPGSNNQPGYVIDQAARLVARFRSEGKRVLLHCWAGQSRTPSVAARYACLTSGADPAAAFAAIAEATGNPEYLINQELRAAVYELAGLPAPGSPERP